MELGSLRIIIWIAVSLVASAARSSEEQTDHPGMQKEPITELGRRAADLHFPDPPSSQVDDEFLTEVDEFWMAFGRIVFTSDPIKDAEADSKAGRAGFMVTSNIAWSNDIAPGVSCGSPRDAPRHPIFRFVYPGAPRIRQAEARIAFEAYARRYNQHVAEKGLRPDENCVVSAITRRKDRLPTANRLEREHAVTQLGQRIAAAKLPAWTGKEPSNDIWESLTPIILASDATKDADDDAKAGYAGLMTDYERDGKVWDETTAVGGVNCDQRAYLFANFLLVHSPPDTPEVSATRAAFEAYASAYNRHVLENGLLKGAPCRIATR